MQLNEDNGYWSQELDDMNKKDLLKSLEDDNLTAIVDGIEGGILGYMLEPQTKRGGEMLNKHREKEE